jgi:hypothetical protein
MHRYPPREAGSHTACSGFARPVLGSMKARGSRDGLWAISSRSSRARTAPSLATAPSTVALDGAGMLRLERVRSSGVSAARWRAATVATMVPAAMSPASSPSCATRRGRDRCATGDGAARVASVRVGQAEAPAGRLGDRVGRRRAACRTSRAMSVRRSSGSTRASSGLTTSTVVKPFSRSRPASLSSVPGGPVGGGPSLGRGRPPIVHRYEPHDGPAGPSRLHPGKHSRAASITCERARRVIDGEAPCGPTTPGSERFTRYQARRAPAHGVVCLALIALQ